MSVKRIWSIGGNRALHPQPIAQAAYQQGGSLDWHGRANGIYCPRGKQYGEGHFLLSSEALQSLDLNAAIDIACEHEDGTTTWKSYYAVRSEVATKGISKPAHLLVVADKRMILARTAVNARYNIANGSTYVASTTNGGAAYTWDGVIAQLWALLPSAIAGTAPTLANAPSSTPQNLTFEGMSAWDAIHQVATASGHVIVLDPIADEFRLVDANGTQAGLADLKASLATTRTLWRHSPSELVVTRKPAEVDVTFPGSPLYSTTLHQTGPLLVGTDSAALPSATGISGTSLPVVDGQQATPANAATLASRSSEIATAVDGLLRPESEPWASVYAGIVEILPGEEITDVRWLNNGTHGTRTTARFAGQQQLDWPKPAFAPEVHLYRYVLDEDMPNGADTSASADIYCLETGDLVAAKGTATGKVQNKLGKFDAQVRFDVGLCYRQDTKYYAILQDPGAGSSNATQAVTFRLDETLTAGAGNTADATVLISGAAGISASDTIEVYSTGDFESWTNCEGLAVKIGSAFWVVHVNQYATLSELTLTGDTHTDGSVGFGDGAIANQETITYSGWVPLSRYPHSFLPSSATIHNPSNLLGLSGDKAVVIYNDDQSRFELFKILPDDKRRIKFALTSDTGSETVASVAAANFNVLGADEFTPGDLPSPATIYDPHRLIINGENGDSGYAAYDYESGTWTVRSFRLRASSSGASLYLFTLTGTISSGSGTATIRNLSDDTEIATGQTLQDPLGHFDGLTSGYRGFCVANGSNYVALGPYVTGVQWDDPDLEQSRDGGTTWTNIDTAEDCS